MVRNGGTGKNENEKYSKGATDYRFYFRPRFDGCYCYNNYFEKNGIVEAGIFVRRF